MVLSGRRLVSLTERRRPGQRRTPIVLPLSLLAKTQSLRGFGRGTRPNGIRTA